MRLDVLRYVAAKLPEPVVLAVRRGDSPLKAFMDYYRFSPFVVAEHMGLLPQRVVDDAAVPEDIPLDRLREYAQLLDVSVEALLPDVWQEIFGMRFGDVQEG